MEHGVGKYRRKTIRKNKPYNRPPKRSVFTRVTDTFKSFISPFTLGWMSNKDADAADGQELESSVDEETSPGCSHPITIQLPDNNQVNSVKSSSSAAAMETEATVEKTMTIGESSKRRGGDLPQLWRNKDSRPQVGASEAHEPRFNPTSYVGTLREKNRFDASSIFSPTSNCRPSRDSSFYNGPTQYGGALNTSMNNYVNNTSLNTSTTSARYSIPRVQQVKVLPNKRRKISFVSNNTTSSMTSQHNSSSRHRYGGGVGNLSSTAEKILQAMEKLNTPVSDARRIPVSERKGTPYAVTRSSRRRRPEGLLEDSITKRKPPVSNGMTSSTPARLSQLKQAPHDNSLVSSKIRFGKSPATKPVVVATTSSADDVISPFKSPHTPLNRNEAPMKMGSSGGGKMKNNRTRSHVSSAGSNDQEDNQYESHLPLGSNVAALPLGGDIKLPSFGKFGNPASSSTPACPPKSATMFNKMPMKVDAVKSTPKLEKKTSASSSINFSFSSPKALEKPASVVEEMGKSKDLPDFAFSKPVPTSTEVKSASLGSSFGDKKITDSSPLSPLSSVKTQLAASKKTSSASMFTSPPPSSLKKGSCMDILGGGKPSVAPSTKVVQPKKKKWECETCMIRNDDDVMKCVACTTPKPGTEAAAAASGGQKSGSGKRVSFGLPPSLQEVSGLKKWSCPTCMVVGNKANDLKCVCCAEPKPGSKKQQVASSGNASASSGMKPKFSFAAPSSTTTSSPAASSSMFKAPSMKLPTSSTTSSGGIKFGFSTPAQTASSAVASSNDVTSSSSSPPPMKPASAKKSEDRWTCSICMIRNDASKAKCAACEAPNPKMSSESAAASASGAFKYGPTSSSLIKFGAPPPSEPSAADTSTKTPASFGLSSGGTKTPATFGLSSGGTKTPASFGLSSGGTKTPASFGLSSGGTKTPATFGLSSGSTSTKTPATFGLSSGNTSTKTPATFGFAAPASTGVSATSGGFSAAKELPKADSSKTEEKSASSSSQPPSYQFGIKSATAPTTAAAGFSFGVVTSSSDDDKSTSSFNKPPPAAASFGFGGAKSSSAAAAEVSTPTKTPAATGGFSGFGTGGAKTAAAAPTTMFGAATDKPTTGGASFSFGAKPATTDQPSTTFNSASMPSSGETSTKSAAFSFGAAKPAPTPEKSSAAATFSFGAKPATENAPAPASASFQFGNSKKPTVVSTTTMSSMFGAASSKPPTTMFGAATAKTPTTMFGTGTAKTPTTMFGAATAKTPTTMFGASTAAPSGLFGAKQAVGASSELKKNLFGASSTTSAAPSMTFGSGSGGASTMFANKTPVSNTSSPFASKNTASSSGLFGGAGGQEKKDPSNSMFGVGGGDKPTGGVIFGGSTAPSSDIFGAKKPVASTAAAPMFGSGGGGGIFGGAASSGGQQFGGAASSGGQQFGGAASSGGQQFGGAASSGGQQFGASSSSSEAGGPFNFAGGARSTSSGGGGMFSSQQATSSGGGGFKFGDKQQPAQQPAAGGGGFKFGNQVASPQTTQQQQPAAGGFSFNSAPQTATTSNFQFGQKTPAAAAPPGFSGFGSQQAPPSVDNSMFSIGTESTMKRSAGGGANRPVRKAQRRLRK